MPVSVSLSDRIKFAIADIFPTPSLPYAMHYSDCNTTSTKSPSFGHKIRCPISEDLLEQGKFGVEHYTIPSHFNELNLSDFLQTNFAASPVAHDEEKHTCRQIKIPSIRDNFLQSRYFSYNS
jgi:hypothetical protein